LVRKIYLQLLRPLVCAKIHVNLCVFLLKANQINVFCFAERTAAGCYPYGFQEVCFALGVVSADYVYAVLRGDFLS
jgi:Gpi18-like mannosyltransferase